MKAGTPGYVAAQARMATRQRGRTIRLRVHEACVAHGDEQLGLSALTGARCDRCKLPIEGSSVMVQLFRGHIEEVSP
jgi:hypothetical protein